MTPETLRGGGVAATRFDPRTAAPFAWKSVPGATRGACRRTPLEFFRFDGIRHPADVAPGDVPRWRETLCSQKKSTATVSFNLSVIRP